MSSLSVSDPIINVENTVIRLNLLAYAKRYRSLYEGNKTVIAVGIYAEDGRQLIYRKFATEEEQQQWLDRLNAAICELGIPKNLVMLPDGTFIREELIEYGSHHAVDRGHTVEIYNRIPSRRPDGKKDKPLVTALVGSKEEAVNFLKALAERLNAA